jgi:cell division protein ZapA (FtsZ GTPase activity inhibitor)
MSDDFRNQTIPIHLWIAGRSYRIRIRKEDEEKVRFAVKQAEDKIANLRINFAGRDDQDFIAMCLLMYATDQAVEANNLTTVQQDIVNSMINKIDNILND